MHFSFDFSGFCCCIPLVLIGLWFIVNAKKHAGANLHHSGYWGTNANHHSNSDSDWSSSDNTSYWGSSNDSGWSSDSYSSDSSGSWSSDSSSSSSSDSNSGDSGGSWGD